MAFAMYGDQLQHIYYPAVLQTENVAGGGQTESFQNVGGERCIQCMNFSKV